MIRYEDLKPYFIKRGRKLILSNLENGSPIESQSGSMAAIAIKLCEENGWGYTLASRVIGDSRWYTVTREFCYEGTNANTQPSR